MLYDVKLPSLGEDAEEEEAVVAFWLVNEGDLVHKGDDLVELTTDKAAFTLPSPKQGRLVEIVAEEGDPVEVGDVLCMLEVEPYSA
jgi:2-oxoisovalerate dehydrogenase E2 component (dihydrolipoyl transacylase)